MEVKLVAFGIAKDIIASTEQNMVLEEGSSIAQLKESLVNRYPEFSKLRSLRFAVNEEYCDDKYVLTENDEVVIIPPVSGG